MFENRILRKRPDSIHSKELLYKNPQVYLKLFIFWGKLCFGEDRTSNYTFHEDMIMDSFSTGRKVLFGTKLNRIIYFYF